ncbi:MAG: L,D-transpeptidase family protein [Syntrophorhabdus aromaticivorans]|uniref:L,D-transpeptidase family protein n=1 Tax=Syntrophorhabdus aromaticivorans TaxID=328301 RepID=A0A971M2Y0_9BACT|nr:L,D-transpeptidase family protein [Syntrophorhabdus aromaticivorans]
MNTTRLSRIYKKLQKFLTDQGEPFLVQSIEMQTLLVCRKNAVIEQYDASTSRFGIGIRENSFKTPVGLHRIAEKIGSGAPVGQIFRERKATGINWDRVSTEENLILTRILRLEGMEEGINKGAGVDSYERCIYIHGTNQEDLVGTPLSHGCLVLRNPDILRLFDIAGEGTLVYIDPPPVIIGRNRCRSVHFAGIFGTGMSALAQYLRFEGIAVSGSDRLLASEDTASIRQALEGLGCSIVNQDGSGIDGDTDAVCVSTAIEESNPDIAAARTSDVPIVHRSDLLAALIASKRTIAVAGTSGKSTVTAMIFEFLTACGKSPSLISGAPLRRLEKQGLIGNAWSGGSDLLVVEADESDGTLVKYAPDAALILNISKDHKSVDEIRVLFRTLASQSAWTASNADDPILSTLPATVRFGQDGPASWQPDREQLLPTSVKLFRKGIEYHLPLPGGHSLENLRAALCVCEHFGCEGSTLADAVRNFEGVARRFAVTETEQNVHVIDDFAHNPAKIAAAVGAARGLSKRIIAVYQPHGFGPTRFLKDEYIATFRAVFRQDDSLYLLPIYYAGGTARKNISSEDIINGLGPVPFTAQTVRDRTELLNKLKAGARSGDCVLVMGARDPSLPALVKKTTELFGGEKKKSSW